jgi:hypothetical protein
MKPKLLIFVFLFLVKPSFSQTMDSTCYSQLRFSIELPKIDSAKFTSDELKEIIKITPILADSLQQAYINSINSLKSIFVNNQEKYDYIMKTLITKRYVESIKKDVYEVKIDIQDNKMKEVCTFSQLDTHINNMYGKEAFDNSLDYFIQLHLEDLVVFPLHTTPIYREDPVDTYFYWYPVESKNEKITPYANKLNCFIQNAFGIRYYHKASYAYSISFQSQQIQKNKKLRAKPKDVLITPILEKLSDTECILHLNPKGKYVNTIYSNEPIETNLKLDAIRIQNNDYTELIRKLNQFVRQITYEQK